MASKILDEMERFTTRLERDGYPIAIPQRTTERMKAMEQIIIDYNQELEFLRYCVAQLEDVAGPASDDVMEIIKDSYSGDVPERYRGEDA